MTDEAYTTIAQALSARAPSQFERIEARFRLHASMYQEEVRAYFNDGTSTPFFPTDQDTAQIKEALKALQREMAADGTTFPRADFRLSRDGDFKFEVYYDSQLLSRLVDVLRTGWPHGVERLRLTATYQDPVADDGSDAAGASDDPDDEGGWSLTYSDISRPEQPRRVDKPSLNSGFDDPFGLVLDLAEATRHPWQQLILEAGATGDDYQVYMDGKRYRC